MKLRVHDKYEEKYHYPVGLPDCGAWIVLAGMNPGQYRIDLFTGSKDKNKMDIYENDKIECKFQATQDRWNEITGRSIGTVVFNQELCQFRVCFKGKGGLYDSQTLEKHYGHVVIGK
jgi:hypothetical protein